MKFDSLFVACLAVAPVAFAAIVSDGELPLDFVAPIDLLARPAFEATCDCYETDVIGCAGTTLPSGKLLLWSAGGEYSFTKNSGVGQTYISVFDPETGETSKLLVAKTDHNMFCPGTAVLPDGTIIITGGWSNSETTLVVPYDDNDAIKQDGHWYAGANMNIGRGYHSMTSLADGRVFTVGGSWSGGRFEKEAEVYDPSSGDWTLYRGIKGGGTMRTKDQGGVYREDNHMWLFTAPNGLIFHAGPSKMMHWIDLEAGNDGEVRQAGRRGNDPDAMNGNAVMYDIGKILTLGGAQNYAFGGAWNNAHIIDINQDVAQVEEVSSLNVRRALHSSVVLPNGQVVVAGGQQVVELFKDTTWVKEIEVWDPVTKKFTVHGEIHIPRTYHSIGLLLKDGRVAMAGGGLQGSYENPNNHPDVELIVPPYLEGIEENDRPVISGISSQDSFLPGEVVEVTMDSNKPHSFALMRSGPATHAVNNDQRRIPLVSVRDGNSFELQMPCNPAILLPGSYFLFALNENGVPSVGVDVLAQVGSAGGCPPTPAPACSYLDFQDECTTTSKCRADYPGLGADDCSRYQHGGVCFCGNDVCGCKAGGGPTQPAPSQPAPSPPAPTPPAPAPTNPAPTPSETCTYLDFQNECTTTSGCRNDYPGLGADDCSRYRHNGVCFCGDDVCGCKAGGGPPPPAPSPPAPAPTNPAPTPSETCSYLNFQNECTTTSGCQNDYPGLGADDCSRYRHGGVCFCGNDVCGCL